MADITKANEQIAAWDENLEKLKNGVFGAETSPEALTRYWKAQAEAGYPGASDNVRYFAELTEMAKDVEKTFDEAYYMGSDPDCDMTAEGLIKAGYRKASDVAREIFADLENGIDGFLKIYIEDREKEWAADTPLAEYLSGKIDAYSSVKFRLAELKKKYTEGE